MKKYKLLIFFLVCLIFVGFVLFYKGEVEDKKVEKPKVNEQKQPEEVKEFFLTANGDNEKNAFYQNSIVLETPFMMLDYEIKHNLSDQEILEYGNIEWAQGIRNDGSRPWMKIILRYTATINGDIPKSFDHYLEAEMNTLRRYLRLFKDQGVVFEMCEFGDEFNLKGIDNLGFTKDNIIDYYDSAIRIIKEEMPDAIVVVDIIPVYAFSEDVYYPGGGYDMIKMDRVPDTITFLEELQKKKTPFTAVGIEIQPGGHTHYDINYTKQFINMITALDLDVYVWEFWILSEPVKDMTEVEKSIYSRNTPPGGYSEKWQAMVLEDLLDFFSENERIIGFNYMCNIHEASFNPRYMTGLIREDGTYKEGYQIFMNWIVDMKIEPAFKN